MFDLFDISPTEHSAKAAVLAYLLNIVAASVYIAQVNTEYSFLHGHCTAQHM